MHFQCSEDKYVTSAYQWMVPFLHRCEKQSPGVANELLKEYLVTLARGDLKLPLKIFQHSKPDVSRNVFKISVHFPLKNYVLFTKFVILGFASNFSSNQKWWSFYFLKMFYKLSPKIFWKFIIDVYLDWYTRSVLTFYYIVEKAVLKSLNSWKIISSYHRPVFQVLTYLIFIAILGGRYVYYIDITGKENHDVEWLGSCPRSR